MALRQSSEALRRPHVALRVSFPLLAVSSLMLGYVGLRQFLTEQPQSLQYGHRAIDLLYDDLQLFVLGADPLQSPGPYPIALEIARFTAPAVTIYAIVEAVRLLLAAELSRLRARRAVGHAIVCGDSPFADSLTRRLQAKNIEVVEIRTQPDDFVSPGEPLRIIGDARDPEVLRAAGVDHAAMVYSCAEDSATNITIALALTRAVRGGDDRPPLFVYSLVTDPDFCTIVQAFFLGRPVPGRVRLDFFTIDHIAARRLFADDRPALLDGRAPHILVAGTESFGRAIVVEAARLWRADEAASAAGRPPLPVTLVGTAAAAVVDGLTLRYPFLATTCALRPIEGDLLALIRSGELGDAPDRILISHPDGEHALKTAMTAEQHWQSRSGAITVRLDGALIGGRAAIERLDVAGETLRVFSVVAAAGDPDLIRDDLVERIARVLHDRYLRGRRLRGEVQADPAIVDPAMVDWDELPPQLRSANRAQAEEIGRNLASVGYAITPRYGNRQEETLVDAEVHRLAVLEHQRWCREREGAGWRYAPQRDEGRKLHPGLRRWVELPEPMRARTYDSVRGLPAVLGDAGFQIVRSG